MNAGKYSLNISHAGAFSAVHTDGKSPLRLGIFRIYSVGHIADSLIIFIHIYIHTLTYIVLEPYYIYVCLCMYICFRLQSGDKANKHI